MSHHSPGGSNTPGNQRSRSGQWVFCFRHVSRKKKKKAKDGGRFADKLSFCGFNLASPFDKQHQPIGTGRRQLSSKTQKQKALMGSEHEEDPTEWVGNDEGKGNKGKECGEAL